jgi:hypothetical protein
MRPHGSVAQTIYQRGSGRSRSSKGRAWDRLERTNLLEPGGTERDPRQAINDLNHRRRYPLGEYAEPPPAQPVPD